MQLYRFTEREPRRRIAQLLALGTVAIAAAACGPSATERTGSVRVMPSPAIPAIAREIPNPLRGQYEDLMQPLFPQGNPAQRGYRDWPGSFDAGIRVTWRQLQPTDPNTLAPGAPDDVKYDFSVIDDALNQLASRGMRLMLRVMAYNSCCDAFYPNDTNIAIPDWLRAIPDAATTFPPPPGSGVTQVVPNWNNPVYLAGFEELLAALGKRYDGDERLSVFEFSGYGDFGENHVGYLRDGLNAPGPAPEDSVQALGYYSQFRDQSITADSIRRLVAANVGAFPRTQLVTTTQNPEIVRQLFADPIGAQLLAPVGIRSDALGVYAPVQAWAHEPESLYVKNDDPLVQQLADRLSHVPVITEWSPPPAGADLRSYYEKGLHDVMTFHVSMTSSINFPDRNADIPMDPQLYELWSQANTLAGYRYSAQGVDGSQSSADAVASLNVKWTNHGSAAATEKWSIRYRVVDRSGAVVRALGSSIDLRSLVGEPPLDGSQAVPIPASVNDPLHVNLSGLSPGPYAIRAAVVWNQHKPQASHVVDYPPMQLAQDGRGEDGWYVIANLDVS